MNNKILRLLIVLCIIIFILIAAAIVLNVCFKNYSYEYKNADVSTAAEAMELKLDDLDTEDCYIIKSNEMVKPIAFYEKYVVVKVNYKDSFDVDTLISRGGFSGFEVGGSEDSYSTPDRIERMKEAPFSNKEWIAEIESGSSNWYVTDRGFPTLKVGFETISTGLLCPLYLVDNPDDNTMYLILDRSDK